MHMPSRGDASRLDMLEHVRTLCALPPRLAGGEGERLAHEHVARVLEGLGLQPEVDEFTFPANAYAAIAAHAGLLAGAGALGILAPPVGAVLSGLASASFYGDLSGKYFWLRRLFPQVCSRNVVARLAARGQTRQRIVLLAHVDAARQGPPLFFEPRRARRAARLSRDWLGHAPNPMAMLFRAAVAQTALGAAGTLGAPARLPMVPLVGLQAFVAVNMAHASFSPVVPGASDNASGVAILLAIAETLAAEPLAGTEVWFVATGCEESMLGGAIDLVRRHAGALDRGTTAFVALDTLGAGRLRYCTGEGLVGNVPHDRGLIDLCARVAEADGTAGARPYEMHFCTDALVPAMHGYRSLSLLALDEDDYPPNYHWLTDTPDAIDPAALRVARDFTLRLIREVDGGGLP